MVHVYSVFNFHMETPKCLVKTTVCVCERAVHYLNNKIPEPFPSPPALSLPLSLLQMSQLWRRGMSLSERLGSDSPMGLAPGPPATAAPPGSNSSWVPAAPLVTSDEPIFLMTSTAQTVSGFFVWTALLLTCHQVSPTRADSRLYCRTRPLAATSHPSVAPSLYRSLPLSNCYSVHGQTQIDTKGDIVAMANMTLY